jgi:hypothetical protein
LVSRSMDMILAFHLLGHHIKHIKFSFFSPINL